MCSTIAASGWIFKVEKRDHSLAQDRPQLILIYALTAASARKRGFKKL
jgi:hypothetical protein